MSKACFTANIVVMKSINVVVYADKDRIEAASESELKKIIEEYLEESNYEVPLALEVEEDRFRCLENGEAVFISPMQKFDEDPENDVVLGKIPTVIRCVDCDSVISRTMPKCTDCN